MIGNGLSQTQPITQIYNVTQKKQEGNSRAAMIKRGKEEADNLHNILPLFQKKISNPMKLTRPKTQDGTKSNEIKRRSEKLKKESNRLQEELNPTSEGLDFIQMENAEDHFGMDQVDGGMFDGDFLQGMDTDPTGFPSMNLQQVQMDGRNLFDLK